MKTHACNHCGYFYDPAAGDLERIAPPGRIAAGTAFEALPDTWRCPTCRAPKADFRSLSDAKGTHAHKDPQPG
ncbi:MAG: rubredoxin [Burkholderiales bacterium]